MVLRSHKDLDSSYAWLVALANCWVNFSVYAFYRSNGLFYVAFMQNYHVNHQMAAWPFTLLCSIYHLIGPVIGLLSHKYSLRSLQTMGTLIAGFALLASYFAPNFYYIIVLVGAMQGLGLGVIRTLSNVVIQQYFVRHRATATGLAMAGGTIGSLFYPSMAEYVIVNHGLEISFVVFGLVTLQAVVGVYLQRPPVLEPEADEEKQAVNETDLDDDTDVTKKESALKYLPLIFEQPMFYVICLMFVTYNVVLQTYLMTIVDVAIANEMAPIKSDAINLIVVFSVADLLGRVSFGWLSDKGYAKPKHIAIITHVILSGFLIATPNVTTLNGLRICAFFVGLLIGIITILWPLLNVDYFGSDKLLPLTLGLNCFFSGLESLIRPFVIGYYLDYLQRYDLLYYTMAVCVIVTAFFWLLEPCLSRKQ